MLGILLAALLFQSDDLAAKLRELDGRVLPGEQPKMLSRDARARIQAANARESEAWAKITTPAQWALYRSDRLKALKDSLGAPLEVPADLQVRTTRTLESEGHRIENLVFESRPGLLVAANLYVPVPERPSMPGILIVHSHHNPKTQSELQDMGVTWARSGCLVLVMDQLGHGERRQHGFPDAASYPGTFRVGRQDYFFRYNLGFQLQLAGESLIGWMAWDLMRGVDLLLKRPGIDPKRIALLGSVAGGGDPAAVAGALDPRISVVAPFNFGGPQPESAYPLPENAETTFNYAGGGSWESTRNLRLSARDGFLPWVIVGSVAPRSLIYGHEFSWDREHDPVWKRLEKIYGFTDAASGLSFATGRGNLKGQPPEATHCNNIGPVHRVGIHAALAKWFEIPVPEKESTDRRPASELLCLTPDLKPRLAHELLREKVRAPRPALEKIRSAWRLTLGEIDPPVAYPAVKSAPSQKVGDVTVERITLEVEPGIVVPILLLVPPRKPETMRSLVIAVAQGGKQEFLRKRSEELAALLRAGGAVALPDLRGTGETRPGSGRGRGSESTEVASTELMLGRTLVALRLQDLRSVMRVLAQRADLNNPTIALWGDSFAAANPPERRFDVPIDADKAPDLSEPLGGLMAVFGALFENVQAIYIRGGLWSFASLLESPYVYAPYDILVPKATAAPDLPEILGALSPRGIRVEELVDVWNRRVPAQALGERYTPAMMPTDEPAAAWILKALQRR